MSGASRDKESVSTIPSFLAPLFLLFYIFSHLLFICYYSICFLYDELISQFTLKISDAKLSHDSLLIQLLFYVYLFLFISFLHFSFFADFFICGHE